MAGFQDSAFVVLVWGLSALGVYQLVYLVRRYLLGGGGYRRRARTGGPMPVLAASEQLALVTAASFQAKPVMNLQEYRVFTIVEREAGACQDGYRVFAQTSLGEVLDCADRAAFSAINSKRADAVVIDRRGHVVIAVEYQGGRHYQGNAAVRDAVKREAFRKAGIEQVEIMPTHSPQEIAVAVRAALRRAAEFRSQSFAKAG
jgi:hypothetical protein